MSGDGLARKEKTQAVADAYLQCDLNARFIHNKAATYLPPAFDDGIDGIFMGDTLIVDRSVKPRPGLVIVAEVDGEYCLRRIVQDRGRILLTDDKGYVPPRLATGIDYSHGVVLFSIHPHSF
jgi:DNA polymerase V